VDILDSAASNLKISVVVPTYNRATLIEETLAGILSQTRPPDEVIVVDDGSTDDTAAVVARHAPTVRTIRINNSGDLVARNTGLRAAVGDLVAFCDSDDIWMPDFLAEMSAQWRAEPALTACYANFRILQDGEFSEQSKFDDAPASYWSHLRQIGPNCGVFDRSIVEQLLSFQPFFPSCMMVARTKFLALGGWDEGVSRIVGGDFATALLVAANPPMGVVRQPLVAIRKHAGNFSGDTERMNLGDARVLEHVLRTRPVLAPLSASIGDSIGRRRREALDSAFVRGDVGAVRDIFRLLALEQRSFKSRIKYIIACLPRPLANLLVSVAGA
jgi:glycosyltransferase involved in cell wall biosynthesis